MALPKFFSSKKTKENRFLTLEIGLEKVSLAVYKKDTSLERIGIGRKSFTNYQGLLDASLEAMDALSSIVEEIPKDTIVGISGQGLKTITTLAKYKRPKEDEPIHKKELEGVLDQVSTGLEEKNKKLFFTAISSAKIDGVKVTNPVNLKGSDAEISCFVAFQDETELSAVNQIANQMDLKINKILPTSFAVFQLITKSDKNVSDGLIIRLAEDSSEETFLTEGHINEVYNLDLGLRKIEFWKIAQEILLKEGRFSEGSPIWLYSEGEESPLEEIKEFFSEFPWREKFGFGQIPTINNLPLPHGVNQSDASLFALAREEADETNRV